MSLRCFSEAAWGSISVARAPKRRLLGTAKTLQGAPKGALTWAPMGAPKGAPKWAHMGAPKWAPKGALRGFLRGPLRAPLNDDSGAGMTLQGRLERPRRGPLEMPLGTLLLYRVRLGGVC